MTLISNNNIVTAQPFVSSSTVQATTFAPSSNSTSAAGSTVFGKNNCIVAYGRAPIAGGAVSNGFNVASNVSSAATGSGKQLTFTLNYTPTAAVVLATVEGTDGTNIDRAMGTLSGNTVTLTASTSGGYTYVDFVVLGTP